MNIRQFPSDKGVQSIDLIAIDAKVRNGRAHIVGTGVTVVDVAIAHMYHQHDADGIADWYGLTLAQVYAALSYYYDHKAEIDTQIRDQIQRAEALEDKRIGTKLRFYLDENVQVVIAEQLKRRGIEAVTARDLNTLGDSDVSHLERATRMGYVLCTYDADYVDLAASGIEHAGIVFGQQHKHTVGEWVAFLELVHSIYDAEEMHNLIEYVKTR